MFDTTVHRHQLDKHLSDYRLAVAQTKQEKAALIAAKVRVTNVETAQRIAQTVAEAVQRKSVEKIAAVVTNCLKAVFEDDAPTFRIEFVQKRGKTEANLTLEKDGLVLDDPLNQDGGGICDVASFALRIVCILLARPKRRPLLVADEPFHHLNGVVYQNRMNEFLVSLSKDFGIQVIMVSDDEWLKVGKVVELG